MNLLRFAFAGGRCGAFLFVLGSASVFAQPTLDPPAVPPRALVTFAPAHADMGYFLRIRASDGSEAECYTPCTLALPAGRTHLAVLAPRAFEREITLSGRPALVKLSHLSKWRYGVGGLLLGANRHPHGASDRQDHGARGGHRRSVRSYTNGV